ncbi:MAG: hypothetical protein ACEY3L_08955 [Wolbachia sp.]
MKITEYLQYHDKGAGGVCQGSFCSSHGFWILTNVTRWNNTLGGNN